MANDTTRTMQTEQNSAEAHARISEIRDLLNAMEGRLQNHARQLHELTAATWRLFDDVSNSVGELDNLLKQITPERDSENR